MNPLGDFLGREAVREEPWIVHCEKLLELDPEDCFARKLLVSCLIEAGQKEKAREEFAKIEALRPPELEAYRTWFQARME